MFLLLGSGLGGGAGAGLVRRWSQFRVSSQETLQGFDKVQGMG